MLRIRKNHNTQDSRVVPHRGTNWAAPWLTSQIGRDAVLSRSYGRGYLLRFSGPYVPYFLDHIPGSGMPPFVQLKILSLTLYGGEALDSRRYDY